MEEQQLIKQVKDREEKRKLKENLEKLKANLIKQNKYLFNLFLKPNDNLIKAIDKFKVSQMTAGQFKFIRDKSREQWEKVKDLYLKGEKTKWIYKKS